MKLSQVNLLRRKNGTKYVKSVVVSFFLKNVVKQKYYKKEIGSKGRRVKYCYILSIGQNTRNNHASIEICAVPSGLKILIPARSGLQPERAMIFKH